MWSYTQYQLQQVDMLTVGSELDTILASMKIEQCLPPVTISLHLTGALSLSSERQLETNTYS